MITIEQELFYLFFPEEDQIEVFDLIRAEYNFFRMSDECWESIVRIETAAPVMESFTGYRYNPIAEVKFRRNSPISQLSTNCKYLIPEAEGSEGLTSFCYCGFNDISKCVMHIISFNSSANTIIIQLEGEGPFFSGINSFIVKCKCKHNPNLVTSFG